MTDKLKNNSEILFIYDAKNCNPNGDMDDENKPRMDKITRTNLVSDVRLKRYIRDYLMKFENQEIFVIQTPKSKDAKERAKELNGFDKIKELIDVKLFGAISTEEKKANNITGPVQFNWGYSLNKVDLLKSRTITSHFKTSGSSDKEGGAGIGKDFRVKYSLIAFSGSVNSKNAAHTDLNDKDLELFDKAMIRSVPLNRTRSKIGQWPRLYLRVILKSNAFLKDLRELVELKDKEIDSVEKVILKVDELLKYLDDNKSLIEGIVYFLDDKISLTFKDKETDLESELRKITKNVERICLGNM